jgi:two-component system alkaline phosphatase synthesis response regulator PhoP
MLLESGVVDAEALHDVLELQRRSLPLASLCYLMGHADEEELARVLSRQHGVPAVVLDRCIIPLEILAYVPRELAYRYNVLPLLEDDRHLFVAARDPHRVADVLRGLSGPKALVPHVALEVTLARTIRAAYRGWANGDVLCAGRDADMEAIRGGRGHEYGAIVVVSDVDTFAGADEPVAAAQEAVLEDVTKEIVESDLIGIDVADTGIDLDFSTEDGATPLGELSESGVSRIGRSTTRLPTQTPLSQIELFTGGDPRQNLDLDEDLDDEVSEGTTGNRGTPRVLIVDDDFATRHLLVKELQPSGVVTQTAASGGEAVRMIKQQPPSLVVLDVMLPEIDGFQICRAIKQSRRFHSIPVILMSAVIDSGRVTDEVLRRYGADAYFEKPLNTDRIKRRIKDLLAGRRGVPPDDGDDSFERALQLYRNGEVSVAVQVLREGLEVDPLSAKHHFVLANLLQKQSMIYEAIDEYEATVDLKPDYFPALTRLAYLYYKQGFSAKAIEAWRRSLPHCPDVNLRQNIEVFMRKLIADMQSEL